MENAASCPYEGESEIRSLYLAGNLPQKDAEAFETHYFDCELCAEAVEVASRLRTAFGHAPVKPAVMESPKRTWLPLAAAAAVAFVAVGLWQATRPPRGASGDSVLRSGMSARISVEVARSPQGAEVSWKTHPGAARYVVRVAASDGMEVWKAETPEPRIRVSPEALAASPPGKSLVVEVEAIDALGRVIATSEPVPLP